MDSLDSNPLVHIQKQVNQVEKLINNNGMERDNSTFFEEGQTGNFSSQSSSKSSALYEKKELVAKAVIALNQVKSVFQCI